MTGICGEDHASAGGFVQEIGEFRIGARVWPDGLEIVASGDEKQGGGQAGSGALDKVLKVTPSAGGGGVGEETVTGFNQGAAFDFEEKLAGGVIEDEVDAAAGIADLGSKTVVRRQELEKVSLEGEVGEGVGDAAVDADPEGAVAHGADGECGPAGAGSGIDEEFGAGEEELFQAARIGDVSAGQATVYGDAGNEAIGALDEVGSPEAGGIWDRRRGAG